MAPPDAAVRKAAWVRPEVVILSFDGTLNDGLATGDLTSETGS